jgi:hypothetical protein
MTASRRDIPWEKWATGPLRASQRAGPDRPRLRLAAAAGPRRLPPPRCNPPERRRLALPHRHSAPDSPHAAGCRISASALAPAGCSLWTARVARPPPGAGGSRRWPGRLLPVLRPAVARRIAVGALPLEGCTPGPSTAWFPSAPLDIRSRQSVDMSDGQIPDIPACFHQRRSVCSKSGGETGGCRRPQRGLHALGMQT